MSNTPDGTDPAVAAAVQHDAETASTEELEAASEILDREIEHQVDTRGDQPGDLEPGEFNSQIAPLLPTPDLRQKYATLYNLADKSPRFMSGDMDAWDANQDFIVFANKQGGGNFDIQRSFAIKAMRVFKMGKRNTRTTTTPLDSGEVLVNTIVDVYDMTEPDRSTEVQGACSTRETTKGQKKNNVRAYHDAVGTAETRALKRGVEEIVGAPIINAMIKEIFGGFTIDGNRLRNVTPGRDQGTDADGAREGRAYTPEETEKLKVASRLLVKARALDKISEADFASWRQRAIDAVEKPGGMTIDKVIDLVREIAGAEAGGG